MGLENSPEKNTYASFNFNDDICNIRIYITIHYLLLPIRNLFCISVSLDVSTTVTLDKSNSFSLYLGFGFPIRPDLRGSVGGVENTSLSVGLSTTRVGSGGSGVVGTSTGGCGAGDGDSSLTGAVYQPPSGFE